MSYIKFKELSKYFDFKEEIAVDKLPDYAKEYVSSQETILGSYKNSKDYAVFTDKKKKKTSKARTKIKKQSM